MDPQQYPYRSVIYKNHQIRRDWNPDSLTKVAAIISAEFQYNTHSHLFMIIDRWIPLTQS